VSDTVPNTVPVSRLGAPGHRTVDGSTRHWAADVVADSAYVVGQPAAYGRAVEQSKVDIERARTLLVF
jgi:hypothetical protein